MEGLGNKIENYVHEMVKNNEQSMENNYVPECEV